MNGASGSVRPAVRVAQGVDTLRSTRPWQAWGRLTRDARDTLFLLGVLAWTILPHAAHLPVWSLLLAAAVLLWRAQLALRAAPLPGRWTLVGVLAVATALTVWSFDTLIGKDAGITLSVVLVSLKTLELRARRDAFVVFFLGFFLVLTQFFYSQSLPVAAAMVLSVWGLLTSLVLAHMPLGRPRMPAVLQLSGRMALLGMPVMVLLFVLFPRLPPLWSVQRDPQATTGLSEHMGLGDMTDLAQDDSVAMRVRFEGGRLPPRSALYFRGPVLSLYDGHDWRPLHATFPPALMPQADLRTRGESYRYEMTLEPQRLAVVPLLEAAVTAPDLGSGHHLAMQSDLQWVAEAPIVERLRFEAVAQPSFTHGPTAPLLGLQDNLELPAGYNPGVLAWAAELRRDPRYATAEAQVLARAVFDHIRHGGYSYSLRPGRYGVTDERTAVDEFWLQRKVGYCEHYAAAFVIVMRALDVPARIVTGFQGGDASLADGWHVVRQRDAHAWAEYWQPGIGWVRADPTAAVDPARVLRGRETVADADTASGARGLLSLDGRALQRWRRRWEAVDNRWNQWVLNYSNTTQMELLRSVGVRSPSRDDLVEMLAEVLTVVAVAGAGWAWWDRSRVDPWTRQLHRLRAALAGLGLDTRPQEPALTLARRVRGLPGGDGQAMAALLERIDRERYGPAARRRPDRRLTRQFTLLARKRATAGTRR